MKKKTLFLIIIILILIITTLTSITIYNKWKIANAEIEVKLIKNLEIEVYSDIKLKDLIKSINGKIPNNFKIDTTNLGEQTINFEFINDDNIKVPYSFKVNIVDKTPPVIAGIKNLTIKKGYTGNIEKELFCGDNYDDTPTCEIIGEYDVNTIGSYNLIFRGTDSSNNTEENNFTLHITEKTTSPNTKTETVNYEEIVKKYKTENTKIGIDVSHWQGDIDFKKVKESGIEFVFIRVGTQKGIKGDYVLDKKFKQNIEGFQEVGIPIGIYYYSYAHNKKSAKKEAEWVLSQIKDYNVELPIVYDWENWSFYQEFNKSFYNLTEMANTFLSVIEKANYKGMLYSSKSYLENIWYETKYDTWLAHYTENTDYEGKYKVWQLCNNGIVPGIDDNMVDINIMYN